MRFGPTKFPEPVLVTRPLLPNLDSVQRKLAEVWDSRWITNHGRQHTLLEERLTQFLKVGQLSLFNNGTVALLAACKALGLSGEVITTPFTFAATPHVLNWCRITPVFCDIDPISMNLNPHKLESQITPTTTAIMPVHVFGVPCDVAAIQAVADRHGLKVVYDAAHACGIEVNGEGIGTFGDVSMFSFHATKLFHTVEGGALVCKDAISKTEFDLIRNFGIKNEEEVLMPGINGKMNEIQAAIGLLVLDDLAEEHAKRGALIAAYREALEGIPGITCPPVLPNVKSNNQYFVIRIDAERFGCSRDYVCEEFKKYNVFTRKYFYPLCSQFSCYADLPSASQENLPVATRVAEEVLSLPLYGGLSVNDVQKIVAILRSFAGQKNLPNAVAGC